MFGRWNPLPITSASWSDFEELTAVMSRALIAELAPLPTGSMNTPIVESDWEALSSTSVTMCAAGVVMLRIHGTEGSDELAPPKDGSPLIDSLSAGVATTTDPGWLPLVDDEIEARELICSRGG